MIHGGLKKTRGANWLAKGRLLAFAVVLGLVVAGCTKGTYQVDIFPEMHYNQSLKRQEPPRLDPPEGAVPITGREVALDFATAIETANPLPVTQEVIEGAAELYRVNCSICHGTQGLGDGTVGVMLERDGYVRPPALVRDATQSQPDGHIFWTISNGVVVMPRFGPLISEDGRWSLVHYLRYLAEQQG